MKFRSKGLSQKHQGDLIVLQKYAIPFMNLEKMQGFM